MNTSKQVYQREFPFRHKLVSVLDPIIARDLVKAFSRSLPVEPFGQGRMHDE